MPDPIPVLVLRLSCEHCHSVEFHAHAATDPLPIAWVGEKARAWGRGHDGDYCRPAVDSNVLDFNGPSALGPDNG